MTQHAAQSAPSRFVPLANPPRQAPRPVPAAQSQLVDGVAAQDAMVALFDEVPQEKPPRMRRGLLRLFRYRDAPGGGDGAGQEIALRQDSPVSLSSS